MKSRSAFAFDAAGRTWTAEGLTAIESPHASVIAAKDPAPTPIRPVDNLATATLQLRDLLVRLGAEHAEANDVIDGLVNGLLEVADDHAADRLWDHETGDTHH